MTLLKDIVPSCRLEELINSSYFFSEAMAKAADGDHSNSYSADSIHGVTVLCRRMQGERSGRLERW